MCENILKLKKKKSNKISIKEGGVVIALNDHMAQEPWSQEEFRKSGGCRLQGLWNDVNRAQEATLVQRQNQNSRRNTGRKGCAHEISDRKGNATEN